ncbi:MULTISPECIES: 5-formyltetrahydrofolate cyclo-ligase [unclassified Sphingobium]|uniref:5-formyltetrahydrofolate cyclo-ligase n=1 Tax=unclassified Sphingobium TaxID=2611147 RepID=UPI00222420BE|nr:MULTISPECIES: 5-formyltetrahydrofolate cyclo-ligase [unclassified Sphingobium]MCW2411591.1 5-formyltetrahydrofolate cyclo-ligase [Sphingobium sp. B8D3D]MCW2416116.1 5-formyltetrahydrofolate cyclo-ligase [Sphingobium sp. B8D3A]
MTDTDRAKLRSSLLARRSAFVAGLPPSVRTLAFRVLPSRVLARTPPGSRVAIYRAMGSEAPTEALIDFLHERGFKLCLPRLGKTTAEDMEFADWSPDDILVPGQLRIPQPAPQAATVTPDVVLTPLVGFDPSLNRIGHGAGYYDRAFAKLPNALRIGMAWSCQMVDALPIQPWDVPLHMLFTEQSVIEGEAA